MSYANLVAVLLIAAIASPMDAWLQRGEIPPVGNEDAYESSLPLNSHLFLDNGETRCARNESIVVYMHYGFRTDEKVPSFLVVEGDDPACDVGELAGLDFVSEIAKALNVSESGSGVEEVTGRLNINFMKDRGLEVDRCVSKWRDFSHGFATRYRGYRKVSTHSGRPLCLI